MDRGHGCGVRCTTCRWCEGAPQLRGFVANGQKGNDGELPRNNARVQEFSRSNTTKLLNNQTIKAPTRHIYEPNLFSLPARHPFADFP